MRHLITLKYIDEVARVNSIRKAAEILAITPSALNRRILLIEEELGAPIFERLPRGVRLNTAGEIFINHIRNQLADMDRVRSQIADLAGVRRGGVSIACPQPLLRYFLPFEIERYRADHPEVTFDVMVRNGLAAEEALANYTADIAVLAEAPQLADFETILSIQQPLYGIIPIGHPLAERETLRLRECLEFPLALPPRNHALRQLLERLAAQRGAEINAVVQSDSYEFLLNFVREERIVSFYIPIGLPRGEDFAGVVAKPIHARDTIPLRLYLGQLRNRHLSVAAAGFVAHLVSAFDKAYECS